MQTTRFEFQRSVSLDDVGLTFDLAKLAAEGHVSAAQVRLHVQHELEYANHALVVRGDGEPLVVVVQVFTALLLHEIGAAAFSVRSCTAAEAASAAPAQGAAA